MSPTMSTTQFAKAVVLLRCGSQQATAFFITPEIAITANHSIADRFEDPACSIQLILRDAPAPLYVDLHEIRIPRNL